MLPTATHLLPSCYTFHRLPSARLTPRLTQNPPLTSPPPPAIISPVALALPGQIVVTTASLPRARALCFLAWEQAPAGRGEARIGESTMKYAIIRSGGKQYRCVEGAAIEVDLLKVEDGATHTFNEVLLVANDEARHCRRPHRGRRRRHRHVVGQIKGPKTISFRYKAKERQRVKRGHRAQYTRLQIEKIEG